MKGSHTPYFRINTNANAVKNWQNALNQGKMHAAPMSEGGVTPVVVGCRGGAIMWILILMLVSGGAITVMELMCDGLMGAAAGIVLAVLVSYCDCNSSPSCSLFTVHLTRMVSNRGNC